MSEQTGGPLRIEMAKTSLAAHLVLGEDSLVANGAYLGERDDASPWLNTFDGFSVLPRLIHLILKSAKGEELVNETCNICLGVVICPSVKELGHPPRAHTSRTCEVSLKDPDRSRTIIVFEQRSQMLSDFLVSAPFQEPQRETHIKIACANMLISPVGQFFLGDEKPRNHPADDHNIAQHISEERSHRKAN